MASYATSSVQFRVNGTERAREGHAKDARKPDLYRVNFEVNDLKPFPHLAFPHSNGPKTPSTLAGFDGELMASFSDHAPVMSVIAILQQVWQQSHSHESVCGQSLKLRSFSNIVGSWWRAKK